MATGAMRAEALSLLRQLLRTARSFSSYNMRHYVRRRTLEQFRHHQTSSDAEVIAQALRKGKEELQVAKRQASVYSMYAREPSIMEVIGKEGTTSPTQESEQQHDGAGATAYSS